MLHRESRYWDSTKAIASRLDLDHMQVLQEATYIDT